MKYIIVRTQFEGVHCFPNPPKDVAYLKNSHRHMFGVVVKVEVMHNDRELEFHKLKHKIGVYIQAKLDDNGVWQMGRLSCEDVAEELLFWLRKEYGNLFINDRFFSVEVNEDGENGAVVDNKY